MGRKNLSTTDAKKTGKQGGLKGGKARAAKMTQSERSAAASKGGKAKAANSNSTKVFKSSKKK